MNSSEHAFARLVSMALPSGGWGYAFGQPLHLEPTALSLLALVAHASENSSIVASAWAALQLQQDDTGAYRLDRGRPEAVWPTPMVLFARAAWKHPREELEKSLQRILSLHGLTLKEDPEIANLLDINPKRVGWPWAINNFSWVEPTAWSVMALRACGYGEHRRTQEGMRLLLDRAFEEGGANYGNKQVLGSPTEPIPTPSALMLLALQGVKHPRITQSLHYLRKAALERPDLEHLGWAILALDAHDQPTTELRQTLDEQYQKHLAADKPIGTIRLALTVLGLAPSNPFRLPEISNFAIDAPPLGNVDLEKLPPEGFFTRIKSRIRNFVISGLGAVRQPPLTNAVHIARARYDEQLVSILKKQFDSFRPYLPIAGKRVVLKPNLVEWRTNKPINTDPRFIDAVIQLFKDEGAASITVAEGPGHWRNVEFLVETSGLGEVLRKHQVRFVDLNHDEPIKVPNLGRLTGLDYLYLTRTINDAEVFVSLPKMKTHHWAVATLSLKNLFGTMPGICYGWPKNELHWRGIHNSIIDIALTQTPHLAIVDGIVGMEGDGPLVGNPKEAHVVVMGMDLVAVDATCCRIMQLPAERIPTLALGAFKKLGVLAESQIPQLGESIAEVCQPFAPPPQWEQLLIPPPKS